MIKYSNTFIKHAPTQKIKNFVFITKIDTKQVGNEVKNFKKRQNVRKTPNHNCKPKSVVDVFFCIKRLFWHIVVCLRGDFGQMNNNHYSNRSFILTFSNFLSFGIFFEKNEKF